MRKNEIDKDFEFHKNVLMKSPNYLLTNVFLVKGLNNIDLISSLYNNEVLARGILNKTLDFIKNLGIKVGDEFYHMPIKMINNGIYFEVPNSKYECECNYICFKILKNELYYCTSEFYEDTNTYNFCCENLNNGIRSFGGKIISSFDDFFKNVESIKSERN